MLQKTTVHGYYVKYEQEDRVEGGLRYLRDDLRREETMVFFDQAKAKSSAQFETDAEEQYTLTYSTDGYYTLIRRENY